MADLNCAACDDLREEVPELIVNGFSNTMCTSLKNDTGLKSSSGHNDCTDLDKLNDCLVGNMETEIDRYDVCDWKDFTKNLINNLWTTLKAMICAICGLWTNVHNLWSYARSFTLKKTGNKIYLEASDGIHGQVTDDDTTYTLTISGHTITLTGSDGSSRSVTVPDNNTTYDLSINGHTVKLTGSDGTTDSVTVPDNNTTYDLSISGHTIKLTGSDGSTDSVTVPDDNTWQPNTKTQNGYVTKGENDEHSVWATNGSGTPDWRSSVVLDGSLTLYDHDGSIGETHYWEVQSHLTISNDNNKKIDTGIDLSAGRWICCGSIGYEPNSSGNRAIGLSFGSDPHHKGFLIRAADNPNSTILHKTYIHSVPEGQTERVYLDGYQNSGSTLDINMPPETYVYCIRIR